MNSHRQVPESRDGQHETPQEEKKHREHGLDKTIEDSFPASDPPSTDPNPDEDELIDDVA